MADMMTPQEVVNGLVAQGVPRERAEIVAGLRDRAAANFVQLGAKLTYPIRLTLPWSALCSDNRKYSPATRKGAGRLVMRPEYREAKDYARKIARDAMTVDGTRFPPLRVPLALVAHVWTPDARQGHDVANFCKCAHDAMEKAIYANDALLHDVRWVRAGVDVDRPRAEITIAPL